MSALIELRVTERMISYADMQEAFKKHRDAQHQYFADLERVALEVVRGLALYLELENKRTISNGTSTPYVTTGKVDVVKGFEPMESADAWCMLGTSFTCQVGVLLEESGNSAHRYWAIIDVTLESDPKNYYFRISAHHDHSLPSTEVRVFRDGDLRDIYEAMCNLVMQLLDVSKFEQPFMK